MLGEVAEWSKAPVSKTGVPQGTVGSNPTLSARSTRMKTFYSELTANPAYYSFGYSVYGVREPEDVLDDCYEQGFLPVIAARDQDPNLMYQARGTRVRLPEFHARHYHGRVVRKAEGMIGGKPSVTLHTRDAFPDLESLISFFYTYFSRRFGKDSMSRERLEAIIASPFVTHVAEYRYDNKLIGYSLEVHGDTFVHVWHQAYDMKFEGAHIGSYLYLELIERAKAAGKQFMYFGVTYGSWMKHKTNFQPLEFWDGSSWIKDPGSKRLKQLFKRDSTHLLAFNDFWREESDPYYTAPVLFRSFIDELRCLVLLTHSTPRIVGVYFLLVALLMAAFGSLIFF